MEGSTSYLLGRVKLCILNAYNSSSSPVPSLPSTDRTPHLPEPGSAQHRAAHSLGVRFQLSSVEGWEGLHIG
jgi:hypothetical protein